MTSFLFILLVIVCLGLYDADKYRIYGSKEKPWWEMSKEESAEYWRNLHIKHYGTEPPANTTKEN